MMEVEVLWEAKCFHILESRPLLLDIQMAHPEFQYFCLGNQKVYRDLSQYLLHLRNVNGLQLIDQYSPLHRFSDRFLLCSLW